MPLASVNRRVLDLGWWDGRAWLGRLFSMNNDAGEHWMANYELVEARAAELDRAGLDPCEVMIPDPASMVDGRDGPCNTSELRRRFWAEVLACLDLSEQLILDSARAWHGKVSSAEENAALEEPITAWQRNRPGPGGASVGMQPILGAVDPFVDGVDPPFDLLTFCKRARSGASRPVVTWPATRRPSRRPAIRAPARRGRTASPR